MIWWGSLFELGQCFKWGKYVYCFEVRSQNEADRGTILLKGRLKEDIYLIWIIQDSKIQQDGTVAPVTLCPSSKCSTVAPSWGFARYYTLEKPHADSRIVPRESGFIDVIRSVQSMRDKEKKWVHFLIFPHYCIFASMHASAHHQQTWLRKV